LETMWTESLSTSATLLLQMRKTSINELEVVSVRLFLVEEAHEELENLRGTIFFLQKVPMAPVSQEVQRREKREYECQEYLIVQKQLEREEKPWGKVLIENAEEIENKID